MSWQPILTAWSLARSLHLPDGPLRLLMGGMALIPLAPFLGRRSVRRLDTRIGERRSARNRISQPAHVNGRQPVRFVPVTRLR